jgi:hypothetical protein
MEIFALSDFCDRFYAYRIFVLSKKKPFMPILIVSTLSFFFQPELSHRILFRPFVRWQSWVRPPEPACASADEGTQ